MKTLKKDLVGKVMNANANAQVLVFQIFFWFGPMTENEFHFISRNILNIFKNQWGSATIFQWREYHGDGAREFFNRDCRFTLGTRKNREGEIVYRLLPQGHLLLLDLIKKNYCLPFLFNDSGKNTSDLVKEMKKVNLKKGLMKKVTNFLRKTSLEDQLLKRFGYVLN